MNSSSPLQDIRTLDTDGALRETAQKAGFLTRRGAIITGGSAAAVAALAASPASALASSRPDLAGTDLEILAFALTLEQLEAAFYAEALAKGALTDTPTLTFAKTVAAHEATHVATISAVITASGGTPAAAPTFNFQGTTANATLFRVTSHALEAVGVGAYLGQSAFVKSDVILGEAAAILAVEARHHAWIADIIGKGKTPSPSPSPLFPPLTKAEVLAAVEKTGFIASS